MTKSPKSAASLRIKTGSENPRSVATYLGSKVTAITMAQKDPLGGRCDGEVGNVGTRLSAAHNHDGLSDTELGSCSELGRMHHDGDVFYTLDVGDVWLYMQ